MFIFIVKKKTVRATCEMTLIEGVYHNITDNTMFHELHQVEIIDNNMSHEQISTRNQ